LGQAITRVRSLVWPGASVLQERINDLERQLERCREESRQLEILDPSRNRSYYVASPWKKKFHNPNCKWIREIDHKKLLVFNSREDALATGRRPCKTCRKHVEAAEVV
jgi:methylphosphotriester-DNA--protein-cysteine methyltransferase